MAGIQPAEEIWLAHLRRVGAAGRLARKALVWRALASYARMRDLPRLTGISSAQIALTPPSEISARLKAAVRRDLCLRRQRHWAFSPVRLRALLAAWIAERRATKAR